MILENCIYNRNSFQYCSLGSAMANDGKNTIENNMIKCHGEKYVERQVLPPLSIVDDSLSVTILSQSVVSFVKTDNTILLFSSFLVYSNVSLWE